MLRDYQQRAINDLHGWLAENPGHPCLVMPTGSGKSWVIAELCRNALQNWPWTKILMLSHVKELLIQDAEKLRTLWPNAPLGMYSASLGQKNIDAITFAGIQSIRGKSKDLGHIDLCIVDECHLIGHKDEGGYRTLIAELLDTNPDMRVIGLTATPYRLGHGLITDKPAIFDDLIEPTSIEELQARGFLARLKSKVTKEQLSTDGVHKRGGEYIEAELQKAVDIQSKNSGIVDEIIFFAGDRKAWLLFCAGVDHAKHVHEELEKRGIPSACITGQTPTGERDRILEAYKAGEIKAITNAMVLTTGFDYPDIDLIAFLRPTMSPGLYMQMAGRGLRLKSHTDHCLILDFAGLVAQHGPIAFVKAPDKDKGEGDGIPPCRNCPKCGEIVHISVRVCDCGYEFPPPEKPKLLLRDDDIQGDGNKEMEVSHWDWSIQTSRNSGKEMVVVTYYGGPFDKPLREYICIYHEGFAGIKALKLLKSICQGCGLADIPASIETLTDAKRPSKIKYMLDGKFPRITERVWEWEDEVPF